MDLDEPLTIRAGSSTNALVLEAVANGGRFRVRDDQGELAAELVAALNVCVLALGGTGFDGRVVIKKAGGAESIILNGRDGDIILNGDDGNQTVRLSGPLGDVILTGADAAEDFEIGEADVDAPAGTVMVIDEIGRLRQSTMAYDRRVAGIISGAGDYRPGVILGRTPAKARNRPIALVGRTYCRVDATAAPIAVGDLLTSSATVGHAMKAEDRSRSHGAILGKALGTLERGFGQIPILVALQ